MIDFFDKNRTHPQTWVRDITFEDIHVVSAKTFGHFSGPGSCIEGFTLRNVTVGGVGGWGGCGGVDLGSATVTAVRPAQNCSGCSERRSAVDDPPIRTDNGQWSREPSGDSNTGTRS